MTQLQFPPTHRCPRYLCVQAFPAAVVSCLHVDGIVHNIVCIHNTKPTTIHAQNMHLFLFVIEFFKPNWQNQICLKNTPPTLYPPYHSTERYPARVSYIFQVSTPTVTSELGTGTVNEMQHVHIEGAGSQLDKMQMCCASWQTVMCFQNRLCLNANVFAHAFELYLVCILTRV